MASSAGKPAGKRNVHGPDGDAGSNQRLDVAGRVLDRNNRAHRRPQGAGRDLREHFTAQGSVDGADVRPAEFLVARMRPACPVRRHDGEEVRIGPRP